MKNSDIKSNDNLEIKEYTQVLLDIQKQIEESQLEAIIAVNTMLNKRNWIIGKIITEKESEYRWGLNFLDKIAKDLQNMYPENKGFSVANVYRMKAFYQLYQNIRATSLELYNLPIFSIPWFHNVVILQKIKDLNECLWYAEKSIENGWSRNTLEMQIKKDLYQREGKAITNFNRTLPSPHSNMAQQAFKDPYVFDFLKLQGEHLEYDLERGLIDHVEKLLLEMGKGFAFIGRQYHLEVDEQDYYIDLLFYHTKLKCYVVVELKARIFMPEDAGKLNFYLSAVDDLIKDANDNPTIGLLLCKTKKNFTAEYALRRIHAPIGVAEYQTEIMKKLPEGLKSNLPTIAEIEAELEKNEILEAYSKKNEKRYTKK